MYYVCLSVSLVTLVYADSKQFPYPSASSDELGIARASVNIGVAQLALKKMEEALDRHLKALKIAERLEDSEMRGNIMGNLGKERNDAVAAVCET